MPAACEPDERGRISLDGAILTYQAAGAGPPVVLIHGLSGSGRWWSKNAGVLAERFRVYSVDLVGFGQSRGRGRFDLGRAAAQLATMLDRLGIAHAGVVGHSMGGLIAVGLAAEYPEQVDRLVLVNAAVFANRRDRRLGRLGWGLIQALRSTPPDFVPMLARDAFRAGPRTLGFATYQLLSADWTAKLGQIRAPTLVICGEQDTVVPVACGRDLAGTIANARLAIMPGCGHSPMWDTPSAFNDLVLRFLSDGGNEIDPEPFAAD